MPKKLSRRRFLKQVAAGSGFAVTGLLYKGKNTHAEPLLQFPTQPNFLFLITDQERATQHFPEGWEQANLPNLTRLKNNGLTFTNAFCNSCMCSPSRATFLTGLYPAQHHVVDTLPEAEHNASSAIEPELDPQLQNMAKMLKSAGYRVYYKGKWHVSKPQGEEWSPEDLRRYGFDEWDPPDAGEDVSPENYGGGRAANDQRFVDDAVSFLQSVDTSQPFALFVSLVNPHDVAGYPKNFDQDYDRSMLEGELKLPSTVNEDLKTNYKPKAHAELLTKLGAGLGTLPTVPKKLNYLNFYGNLLKYVDNQMGQILDALKAPRSGEAPLSESTLVFRFADHGEMGLSHGGLRQKMFVTYDEAIHVPLVVSNPVLFPAPRTSDALVSLIDLFPTVATLAQVPNREQWEFRGMDFSSIILEPSSGEVQDAILFTFDDVKVGMENVEQFVDPPNRIRCIREKNWKYARYFDGEGQVDPEYEMYDLIKDPLEMENLANPSHPRYKDAEVVAQRDRLAAKLKQLEKEKLAPLGTKIGRPGNRQIPRKIRLWQNYPNPFSVSNASRKDKNSMTHIKFQVIENGPVHLSIYNTIGQVVKTLVNEEKRPGIYLTFWDGTNASGRKVAVGIYYFVLKTAGQVLSRQMVLTK